MTSPTERGTGGPERIAAAGSPELRQALELTRERVRENLVRVARTLSAEGLPRPALDGKVLRPLTAYLTVPEERRRELDDRFWWGALAVEMVHEASLLHDDILDEAPERRGRPTLSAASGIGPALVLGDHLLTGSYRAAVAADSPEFLRIFIRSVERTVAGEIAQEQSQGRLLGEEEYFRIITGKSGELFRAVFSLAPTLLGVGSPETVGAIGARLGCLYQMVDDFLDYCPDADRGKVPLQDLRQRKWTWPLGLIGAEDFAMTEPDVLIRLFSRPGPVAPSPMESGVERMQREFEALVHELRDQGLETRLLGILLDGWASQLEHSTAKEVARFSHAIPLPEASAPSFQTRPAAALPDPSLQVNEPASAYADVPKARVHLAAAAAPLSTAESRLAYFGRHARTFRFAARLFPAEALENVAGVYSFCRFTDDLVDEAGGLAPEILEARLDAWLQLAGEAYRGEETGVALLDQVLGTARERGVPFHYVEDLVEGVRMDVHPRAYRSMDDLRGYSYRVASVVGGWLTQLFGVHDPSVLDRAYALGHAMQLTNILRDVGEDLENGRLYLPLDCLQRYGVDRDLLEGNAREGAPVFPGYRALLEDLMAKADADYERAFRAIPALPPFFQGPVAVAARTYQGIHAEIRKNRYDNLSLRARTSLIRKLALGAGALFDLLRARRETRRTFRMAPEGTRLGPSGMSGSGGTGKVIPIKDSREATA